MFYFKDILIKNWLKLCRKIHSIFQFLKKKNINRKRKYLHYFININSIFKNKKEKINRSTNERERERIEI